MPLSPDKPMLIQYFSICLAIFSLVSPSREKIEARANDEILTTSELARILKPIYRQYEQSASGKKLALQMKKARASAISSWIEHQLILQEAQKIERFQIDQMEVDKRFEEARNKFTSQDEFDRALTMEGLDEDEYRKNLEDQFKVKALIYQKVTGLISISPQDIKDYYREHGDDYRDEEMVRISHILIPAPKDAEKNAAAREQAEAIINELKDGADFSKLARKYSQGPRADQGGDLGYYKKGDMLPKLDEATFSLEVGQISGIIETDLGYHIIKCAGKKEAYQKSLEELWEEIEDQLYQVDFQKRYDKWIDMLKSRAYIVIED